jgi:hypothetical protein
MNNVYMVLCFGLLTFADFGAALAQNDRAQKAMELLALSVKCPNAPSQVKAGSMIGRITTDNVYTGDTRTFRVIAHKYQQWEYPLGYDGKTLDDKPQESHTEAYINFKDLDPDTIIKNDEKLSTDLHGNTIRRLRLGVHCLNDQSCVHFPPTPGNLAGKLSDSEEFVLTICDSDTLSNAMVALRELINLAR